MSSTLTTNGTSAAAGVVGDYEGSSFVLKSLIVFFAGLSMYNSLELIVLIFLTFSEYGSVYFWSLLVSSLGLIPYALGFTFKFFGILTGDAKWVSLALLDLGWYAFVTGSSVVLWSRLHLIVTGDKGHKILKWTKWMIVVDAVVLHIPTTVVTFGSNGDLQLANFVKAYNVIEKFQMTGFFLQEVILSSIYISQTLGILRASLQPQTRGLMHQLIFINVAIVIMDTALLGLECASLYVLETMIKCVAYSIKLKFEFAILSRLVQFVGGGQNRHERGSGSRPMVFIDPEKSIGTKRRQSDANNISDFVDLTKVDSDYTHAAPERTQSRFSARGDDILEADSDEKHDMG